VRPEIQNSRTGDRRQIGGDDQAMTPVQAPAIGLTVDIGRMCGYEIEWLCHGKTLSELTTIV
jgi:hypothetical protein